jgi:hypothetical protein
MTDPSELYRAARSELEASWNELVVPRWSMS